VSTPPRPDKRPANPNFSSGPCAKRPGWSLAALEGAAVGRSHRSNAGRAKLARVIERTRAVLGVPAEWRIAIVPASDTGAVEMALWSLLGARGVHVLAWENFGNQWAADVTEQLKIEDVRVSRADYGALPDLAETDFDRDVVFAWNGTTSGVRVPDGEWIDSERAGLTICDATSAAFAMELPWDRLDVTTYSWQKVLGGEGQHGMLILGPRAVERLESHTPPWPVPKVFRLTEGGKVREGLFRGETINTPSLIAVEDVLDALEWVASIGGLGAMIGRSRANLAAIERWVARTPWVAFVAEDAATRSNTSVCLRIDDAWFAGLPAEGQAAAAKRLVALLEDEGVAHDIGAYPKAPPGLRVWAGGTVEEADLEDLFPWLDWAYAVLEEEASADA
jgi:phosphoserine aminotransferase